jgi:hypothetical protein
MKPLIAAFFALLMSLPLGAEVPPNPAEVLVTQPEVQHGGGCRKSSPPGKCCHAGSKPYHCH